MEVLCVQKYPDNVQNMLGYQAFIVDAHTEYEGDGWQGYDHWFRQTAAAVPDTPWAKIKLTLLKQSLHQASSFSLTHVAEDCDWAPTPTTSRNINTKQGNTTSKWQAYHPHTCFEWNNKLSPACPYPNCKYQHICPFVI